MTIPTVTHLQALILACLAGGPELAKDVKKAVGEAGVMHTDQAFYFCTSRMQRDGLIRVERVAGLAGGRGREDEYQLTAAGRAALRGVRGFYRELEAVA